MYGWGYTTDGQLGINTGNLTLPLQISTLSDETITSITCGYNFSIAINSEGQMYTFGNNMYGALGIYADSATLFESEVLNDVKWLSNYMNGISEPITTSITLPNTAPNGSTITWTSTNTYYIDDDGTLLNRPDCYGSDTDVKLSATLTYGDKICYPNYTITVKQDETIKPATNIPIRSIGMEYEQTYPDINSDIVTPNVESVSYIIIDETAGKYKLCVDEGQYMVDDSSNKPFFFWSSREGTFLPVEGCNDYSEVYFTIDEESIGKDVKVTVGLGDGLGYVDKKAFILNAYSSSENVDENDIATLEEYSENNSATISLMSLNSDETYDTYDSSPIIAIGLDNTSNMIAFDQARTKTWLSGIEGLIDVVGDDIEFNIVTKNNEKKNIANAERAKELISSIMYGTYDGDALSLLNATINTFENSNGSNMAIVFASKVEDEELLEDRIEELDDAGILTYIILLGGGYTGKSNNIINCENELELRINLCDIYDILDTKSQVMTLSANEDSSAEFMTLSSDEETTNDILTDFKLEKHDFNITKPSSSPFGAAIASVLNLYGCLPAKASKNSGTNESYDLFNNADDIYNLIKKDTYKMSSSNVNNMLDFYEELEDTFKFESSNVDSIIEKNINYRFPVVVIDEDTRQ